MKIESTFEVIHLIYFLFFPLRYCDGLCNHLKSSKNHVIQAKSNQVESELLNILIGLNGRGTDASIQQTLEIETKIDQLERKINIENPTKSAILDGCWRLLYTSSPGTNSPIQRTFTSSDQVLIFQVVNLIDSKASFLEGSPDISNIVCFSDIARLRVTALASTVLTLFISLILYLH